MSARCRGPYYVVVDSGGWFKSKDFLVPIGHTRLDEDRDALVINIPKERLERFPGIRRDEFATLKKDDVQRMNDAIRDALGDTPALYTPASDMPISLADPLLSAWGRPAYTQPDWWAGVAPPLGSGLSADDSFRASADYMASEVPVAFGEIRADELVGREWEGRDRRHRKGGNPQMRAQAADASRGQASMRARATDQSPHPEGRAQPGDVRRRNRRRADAHRRNGGGRGQASIRRGARRRKGPRVTGRVWMGKTVWRVGTVGPSCPSCPTRPTSLSRPTASPPPRPAC